LISTLETVEPLTSSINEQRPTSGTKKMKFPYKNAKPHVTDGVKSYVKRKGILIILQYSPERAP